MNPAGSGYHAAGKSLSTNGSNGSRKLVCYYTNWSQYRPKEGKFLPEDIDPSLCTHLIFAFGWMKKNQLSAFDATDETKDGKIGLYERIVKLKDKNPKLQVLLAIGEYLTIIAIMILLSTSRVHQSSPSSSPSMQTSIRLDDVFRAIWWIRAVILSLQPVSGSPV